MIKVKKNFLALITSAMVIACFAGCSKDKGNSGESSIPESTSEAISSADPSSEAPSSQAASSAQQSSEAPSLSSIPDVPKEVKISISAPQGVTQLERLSKVQITATLENAEQSDVNYYVGGPAKISKSGELTVDETASVGGEINVFAMAKGVLSNTLKFTVKDTAPTSMAVFQDKTILKENDKVVISATFEPSYATQKDFELSIGTGSDLAEVSSSNPHAVVLKQGVKAVDHVGDPVVVTVTSTANESLTKTVNLKVGTVDEKDTAISIAAVGNVSEVQRNQQVEISVSLENALPSDVEFFVSGSASVSAGVVTISKTAAVGSKIGVHAVAKGVASNTVEFTVVDTLPESMTLEADKTFINNGEVVHFEAHFEPEWTTVETYSLVITSGTELVTINPNDPHAIQLKEGVNALAHIGENVTVQAIGQNNVSAQKTLPVGNPSDVEISLSAPVTSVKRHQNVQLSVELLNADEDDVTYTWYGACSVSASGLLTVNDDAAVGSKIAVYATAKSVDSNTVSFTVVDTAPESISLQANKTILKDGEKVSFSATYAPAYTTLKGFSLAVTSGADYAEVSSDDPYAVVLKEGVVAADHVGQIITVEATSSAVSTVKSEFNLKIGTVDEKDTAISIAAHESVTQLERHGSVQIDVTLENATLDDVSYFATGAASVSSSGLLTIADNAIVGSTVSVHAVAKGVASNVLNFTVKDTAPDSFTISPNKNALMTGEVVSFTAEFIPTYTSLTNFSLEIVEGYGDDIAELHPTLNNAIRLKDGVSDLDHVGEAVKVRATSTANNVQATYDLAVGLSEASLEAEPAVVLIGRDNTEDLHLHVEVFDDEFNKIDVDASRLEFVSDDENVVRFDSTTGRLIPVGHGETTVHVSFMDFDTVDTTVTVLVPPTDMEVVGYNNTVLLNGLHTGKASANKIASPFEVSREDDYTCSQNIDYSFKLYDSENKVDTTKASDDIATVENGYITFKVEGKVVATATSNSTIGTESASVYEKTKDMVFHVNSGVNVYTQGELHFALQDKNVGGVNLMNTIELRKILNQTVPGKGTYSSYYKNSNNNETYIGFSSLGDKVIQGNAYNISLANLEMATNENMSTVTSYDGPGVITFFPGDYQGYSDTQDIECTPFHVEVYDLSFIGNNDYNGNYVGQRSAEFGDVELEEHKFVRTYRRAMVVGTSNGQPGFYGWDTSSGRHRVYQYCAGAYVDRPIFKNISIQGFETGVRFNHVVNGYVENLDVRNQYNNGIEAAQCIMEFHDTTIGQLGGFGIEIAPDETNCADASNFDWNESGKYYTEKSRVVMSGYINSDNLNTGTSTERMEKLGIGNFHIDNIIQAVVQDMFTTCITELYGSGDADYQALATDATRKNNAINYTLGILGSTLFNNGFGQPGSCINFFSLIYLVEYTTFGGQSITGDQAVEFVANVSGGSTNLITLHDLMKNCLMASAKGKQYTDYVDYAYIKCDIDGETLHSQGGVQYVGQTLLINNAYNG